MNTYLSLVIPVGAAALLLLVLYVRAMRKRAPYWAASVRKGNEWPTRGGIYVCHCPRIPGMAKVGTTQRTSIRTRMKEIEGKMTRSPVRLHFAIDFMPFAWAVEQEAHRVLKSKRIVFPPSDPMGVEWYRRADDADLQEIVDAIEQAAFAVRFYAVSNNCWPAWAKPLCVDMRFGRIERRPLFTKQNSPGLKIAS